MHSKPSLSLLITQSRAWIECIKSPHSPPHPRHAAPTEYYERHAAKNHGTSQTRTRRRRRCYSCRSRRRRRVGGDRARGRRGCRERGSGCTGAVAYVSLLPRSSSPAAATIARARRTRGRRGGRERGDQVRLYTSIVKHVAAEMDPCRRIYVPCPAPVFVLRSHLNTCIHLTAYIRIDAYRVHEFFYLYF